MVGDVEVVGLAPGIVPLADIGMDVAHGVVVRIPADLASQSKDLWRAISQRQVFRLQAGPNPVNPRLTAHLPDEVGRLQDRIATLERENTELRANAAFERAKFDEILGLLRQGPVFASSPGVAPKAAQPVLVPNFAVVEVETPSFIPSTIKGENSESRVTVDEGASEGGAVSDARSALRKLRRNE